MDRMKGRQWKSFKLAVKQGFVYGVFLELMFIGSGYMLYREYTTNKGENPFKIDDTFSLNSFLLFTN